ncbi:MAG: serine hydrolase domain-containing protein [Thermomicrobiales bacterium]
MSTNLDTSQITDPDFRQLCDYVVERMARYTVPGVAIGVLRNGQEFTAGFGITNVEAPVPVDGDTLFQIGSTSKTFTGTVVMRLVEEGKLDLDAPIRTYLPNLKLKDEAAAAGATLRHLFNHTAGWVGDYFDDTGSGDDALAKIVADMAELAQITPFGKIFSYNNAAFYLAGHIIETVTGKPFEQNVKELIFDPLGMDHSFFFAHDAISRRVAVGHISRDGKSTVARPWALARAAHAAGGIVSTATDQLKYARFQMGDGTTPDGTRLLSQASLTEMQTPRTLAGSGTGALGVTWMIKTISGVKTVRHGGATNGQLSAFVMAPEQGFAITVLTNGSRGTELHNDVTKWALAHYLDAEEQLPTPLNLAPDALAAYAGHYDAALSSYDLEVRDGELWAQATSKGGFPLKDSKPAGPPAPPFRIAICADDMYVALDPPFKGGRGEFLRDEDGSIAWMRLGVRIAKRQ